MNAGNPAPYGRNPCQVTLLAAGTQQALQGKEPRLVWEDSQSLRQPLLGDCHIPSQQRRLYASEGSDPVLRTLPEPRVRCLFSAAEVAAKDIEPLEVAIDRDRPSRLQHIIEEKQVGEHRPQVSRSVQVVDDPGADRRLRQDELNRRLRAFDVALDDAHECLVA